MKKYFEPIYLLGYAIIIAVLAYFTSPWWSHETTTVNVTGALAKAAPGSTDQKYLVFTDKGVFQNTDSWYYFKFNSSDVQGRLMQPGKYTINYYGWRVPFFSTYPNIVSVN